MLSSPFPPSAAACRRECQPALLVAQPAGCCGHSGRASRRSTDGNAAARRAAGAAASAVTAAGAAAHTATAAGAAAAATRLRHPSPRDGWGCRHSSESGGHCSEHWMHEHCSWVCTPLSALWRRASAQLGALGVWPSCVSRAPVLPCYPCSMQMERLACPAPAAGGRCARCAGRGGSCRPPPGACPAHVGCWRGGSRAVCRGRPVGARAAAHGCGCRTAASVGGGAVGGGRGWALPAGARRRLTAAVAYVALHLCWR